MIFDALSFTDCYAAISPAFQKAFAFLKNTNLGSLEIGRHDIDGDNAFALVSTYAPKPVGDAKWEAHRKYADIQVIVAGEEKQGFAPMSESTDSEGYIAERDIEFLRVKSAHYILLKPGLFAVYFPQDAHQPGVAACSENVRKIVVKVRV